MLPGLSTAHMAVIAVVALLVVGPKDLPMLLRKLGQFTARMRGLANEFRASFDEMARQSELDDLRREVEALRDGRFGEEHKPDVEGHMREIDDHMRGFDPDTAWNGGAYEPPAAPAASTVAAAEHEPELPFEAPAPRTLPAEQKA